MHVASLLFSLLFLVQSSCSAASVCEALDHRLEYNGKEIEISGKLNAGTYTGFFVCENEHCDPCVNRWIFSWPSAILFLFEGESGKTLAANVRQYVFQPVNVIVKGRLRTSSDYYVINLPWRKQRPLGRFEFGGVAAAITVSEIRFLEKR